MTPSHPVMLHHGQIPVLVMHSAGFSVESFPTQSIWRWYWACRTFFERCTESFVTVLVEIILGRRTLSTPTSVKDANSFQDSKQLEYQCTGHKSKNLKSSKEFITN